MAPDQLDEARRWLSLAREDLEGAEMMLARDDVAPRLACFLAQQAAEKAIKARLIRHGVAFARIHDLLALRALLPQGASAGLDDDDLAELSAWATEARYPSDQPDASAREAARAVEAARILVAEAERDVGSR